MKKIREFFLYIAAMTAYYIIRSLPGCAVRPAARMLAYPAWMIPGVSRLVCANIRCAFPEWDEKQVKKVGFESIFNMLWNMIEFFWTDGRPHRIERCYVMPDVLKNQLDGYSAKDVRMIYVNPHHGSWEGSGVMATYHGKVRMAAIAKPVKNYYLNKFFNDRMRGIAAGFEVIFSKGAMRGCISALRDGKSLAILVDQNTRVRDGGVFVNFFGVPVPSSTAPAVLKKYCDARGIPCVVMYGVSLRHEDGKLYSMSRELSKPFDEYADDAEVLQELLDISEEYIRKYPEQYLWLYHRFQHIPPDASDELKRRYPYYAKVPNAHFFSKTAVKKEL
ncbi:MAG: hypothetical protein IJW08_06350 [Lentisphaeria bacterium]|nr:hypothetical protein [Lentisphaeria bacterium]